MQYLPMKLSVEDRVKNLLPAWLYYPYKIGREARAVEPELRNIARIRSRLDARQSMWAQTAATIVGPCPALRHRGSF